MCRKSDEYYTKLFADVTCVFWEHQPRPFGNGSFGRGKPKIILYLNNHPEGANPGALSEYLNVGTGRIGNALKDLEEKGLIERSKESKDKRKTVVVLTEKGKEKAAGFKAFFTLKIRQMVDALGGDDFELMCNLIKKAFIATVSEVDKNAEIV